VKKSAAITFGVIMSALVLCACEERRCVDAEGKVVDEKHCKEEDKKTRSGGVRSGGFRWYYGGSRGGVGTRISGGSYTPGVVRGGFGRLAGLHGSGHG